MQTVEKGMDNEKVGMQTKKTVPQSVFPVLRDKAWEEKRQWKKGWTMRKWGCRQRKKGLPLWETPFMGVTVYRGIGYMFMPPSTWITCPEM